MLIMYVALPLIGLLVHHRSACQLSPVPIKGLFSPKVICYLSYDLHSIESLPVNNLIDRAFSKSQYLWKLCDKLEIVFGGNRLERNK
jgi:hypothetical protein